MAALCRPVVLLVRSCTPNPPPNPPTHAALAQTQVRVNFGLFFNPDKSAELVIENCINHLETAM